MKKALALAQLATAATASMACTPGNLDFEPKFEPGRSQLFWHGGTAARRMARRSARALSEWRRNPCRGTSQHGSRGTAQAGRGEAGHVAWPPPKSRHHGRGDGEAGIVDRAIDSAHLRSAELRPKVLEYLNTAGISIHPRCPHPCCLGSEPIEGGDGAHAHRLMPIGRTDRHSGAAQPCAPLMHAIAPELPAAIPT